jgi:2-oxoglutarate ferredoxin oxidoreductase subunit alpha
LFPFPEKEIAALVDLPKVKLYLTVEMSLGQMVEDVRLAVNGKKTIDFYGRTGGIVPTPEEVVNLIKQKLAG